VLNSPGCIACIVKQAYSLSKLVGIADEETQKKIIFDTMEMLLENRNIETAPHFSLKMLDVLKKYVDVDEKFAEVKERNRKNAEYFTNYLSILVDEAEDKLEMAVRVSIMGNTIDLAANPNFNLENDINLITSDKYNLFGLENFKSDLKTAKTILFIADNYEEAVFDKFLLNRFTGKDVVFAVRSNKVYNDITYEDAVNLGIDKLCKVIESGSMIAGTALEQCSEEFMKIYNDADIVISKGQGNYETLLNANRPIYFLFKVKCDVIAQISGNKQGTSVMYFHERTKK